MSDLVEKFRALHAGKDAFVMPNAWDAVSALMLRQAGFRALGTSSVAIAFGLGRRDGLHAVPREAAIANGVLLSGASGLPVNGDLEDGFGPSPEDCAATVNAAIDAGLAGLGIEDTTADPRNPIHRFDDAVARMRAAVAAAAGRIVLTGRTDLLLFGRSDLSEVIRRLVAFAELGCDVLYAPGVADMDAVQAIVAAVAPKPVNVVVGPRSGPVSVGALSAAGVKRISLGGALHRVTLTALAECARRVAGGDLSDMYRAIPSKEIAALMP
ncbi:MAG: isocitrate lyase/phosphoenolpyruvate mutase family protein [Acetobacteraceae bacterium]|nr:isocitrate lyase/phosphoenolpyruvate mutase family protein [Acetobacteraceae bacterium]